MNKPILVKTSFVFCLMLMALSAASFAENLKRPEWPESINVEYVMQQQKDLKGIQAYYSAACSGVKKQWKRTKTLDEAFVQIQELMKPLEPLGMHYSSQPMILGLYDSYYFTGGDIEAMTKDRGIVRTFLGSVGINPAKGSPSKEDVVWVGKDARLEGAKNVFPELHDDFQEIKSRYPTDASWSLSSVKATSPYVIVDFKASSLNDLAKDDPSQRQHMFSKLIGFVLNNYNEKAVELTMREPRELPDWTFSHYERIDVVDVIYAMPIPEQYHEKTHNNKYVAIVMKLRGKNTDGVLSDIDMYKSNCTLSVVGSSKKLSKPFIPPHYETCGDWEHWWYCAVMDAVAAQKGHTCGWREMKVNAVCEDALEKNLPPENLYDKVGVKR